MDPDTPSDSFPRYDEPYRTVELIHGFRWPKFHLTLDEAILTIDGAKQAELFEVEEFVPGARTLYHLASVLDGEWIFNDEERLNMPKVAAASRNVAEDLIGDGKPGKGKGKVDKKVTKVMKAKGNKKGTSPVGRSPYTDDQRIKVLKPKTEYREGTNNAKLFALVQKSGTIGAFKKARSRGGFGDSGVGGFFGSLVKDGIVKVT